MSDSERPAKSKQYIRRYGLYSSRTRGIWERFDHIMKLAPSWSSLGHPWPLLLRTILVHRWKEKNNQDNIPDTPLLDLNESSPDDKKRKSAWAGRKLRLLLADATTARLIKKVYGVDPLICPKCGSGMKILSVIFNPDEIKKILTHLAKIGRAPPNFDPTSLN